MVIECDACCQKTGEGVSKCCKADVWAELRAHSERYICKECDEECDVIKRRKK
jgi:hypothetical protein